jgi:uncharacterized HAD superfamily protein
MIKPVKAKIGVDLDDVVFPFTSELNKWHNSNYGTNYKEKEYTTYFFSRVWNCTQEEAAHRVELFEKTEDFIDIQPLPGALTGLMALRELYPMIAITSRGNELREITKSQIAKNLPGIFLDLRFSLNHYNHSTETKTKADIGLEHGIELAIEDSEHYAKQYSDAGIKVILFDHPANQKLRNHPRVLRVKSWKQATPKVYNII